MMSPMRPAAAFGKGKMSLALLKRRQIVPYCPRTRSGAASLMDLESGLAASNELEGLQARVPVSPDDQMIVDDDAECPGRLGDRPGHLDVGLRRSRIA